MTTDAIVLPANEVLEQGSGTSRAIFDAAGEKKLIAACRKLGECGPGDAVITDGFDLPAKYIIHAVCPRWHGGNRNEEEQLRSAYLNSLGLAEEKGLNSIAFPLLSTGNYRFPVKYGLIVAKEAIEEFLDEHEMDVYLVLYNHTAVKAGKVLFPKIEHFIDDNYVGEKDESYYAARGSRRDRWRNTRGLTSGRTDRYDQQEPAAGTGGRAEHFDSVDDLIRHGADEQTFSDYLMDLIEQKGLTNSEAYKKANVSRSVFHMIWSNKHQIPKKNTVIAFAIALELDLDETNQLLMKAGYAFSNAILFDILIQYFIRNKMYNVYEINEILYDYNQPLLGMKTS